MVNVSAQVSSSVEPPFGEYSARVRGQLWLLEAPSFAAPFVCAAFARPEFRRCVRGTEVV